MAQAGPSETWIDKIQKAPVSITLRSILQQLGSALAVDAQAINRGDEDRESTLFVDPFPYVHVLFPLLGSKDSDVSEAAECACKLFAQHSSGKEMAMAINERLATISRGGSIDEDSSEEEDLEDNAPERNDDDDDDTNVWNLHAIEREFPHLVSLFELVLKRIKTQKPSRFLKSATASITAALEGLLGYGAFDQDEDRSFPGVATAASNSVLGFVRDTYTSQWISHDEAGSLFRDLLLSLATLMHPYLPVHLAQAFFNRRYPKYKVPGRSIQVDSSVTQSWELAARISSTLGLQLRDLLELVTAKDADPAHRQGSFILLTHCLALSPNLSSIALGKSHAELASIAVTMLSADGAHGRPPLDEALFWTWWTVEGALRAGEALDESVLFPLIELLGSQASLSPASETRFLAFRLLSTLVLATEKEEIQLMIVKDLIEDCPYEQLRVAGISLLREILVQKFSQQRSQQRSAQDSPPPSLFLSPILLHQLGPTLLRFSPVDLLDSSSSSSSSGETSAARFIEDHYRMTMEKLSFVYFLLASDQRDQTNIRSMHRATEHHFLGPLRRKIDTWSDELRLKSDEASMSRQTDLLMLRLSLDRIDSVKPEPTNF